MLTINSVKNYKIGKYMSFFLVMLIILFSTVVLVIIKKDKAFFLHSQDVVKVNNEIDSLFKDYVYFPLLEDPKERDQLEKEISEEINLSLLHLEALIPNQFPTANIVHEIRIKWELLRKSDNLEKINYLYDLEVMHDLINRNEADQVGNRLKSSSDKNSNLAILVILIGSLSIWMIYILAYYTNNEIIQTQKLLEESRSFSKSMSMFLAMASHELRTPLNGIIGLAQILRSSFLPELETYYADNIYHSGKSLLKITNYILEHSNNTICEIKLENDEFSLKTIVQQVLVTFSTEAIEKKIEFKYLIDDDVPLKIYGDSARLLQVLYSLIGNAVRSTMNGVIILKISVISKNPLSGVHLLFSIKDSGTSLSEEELKQLFLPFSEIQFVGKFNEISPVLGFSFCRKIVEAMKGELTFSSKEGEGKEFSFTASFSQYSEEVLKDIFLKEYTFFEDHFLIKEIFDKSDRPTILIVDDDPANLLIIQALLERLGASVLKASNGNEAINEFPRALIDLVLMDCQMPVMDGYEATKIIRKHNPQVPILAIGASLTLEDQSKCLKVGMNGFISKPIEIENLIYNIKKFLNFELGAISKQAIERLEKSRGRKGMIDFLQEFNNDLLNTADSIDKFLKMNDLEAIHKVSHKIKSSSQLVGARGLTHLLVELENEKNLQKVATLKEQIDLSAINLKKNITEYINYQ